MAFHAFLASVVRGRSVFAGQNVGIKEVSDNIWLASFMHYDVGYFDHEKCKLESVENPFHANLLPTFPV